MTDLRTIFIDMDNGADLALDAFALSSDDGLETAVILSLFTDARAKDDDTLPIGQTDRRGWWADTVLPDSLGRYDQYGSRLWLLHREKQMPEVLRRAKDYAQEGLAWLLEDKVARKVDVVATNPQDGWLVLDITVTLHNGGLERYQFGRELPLLPQQ